jgi:molybdopterin-binding protein
MAQPERRQRAAWRIRRGALRAASSEGKSFQLTASRSRANSTFASLGGFLTTAQPCDSSPGDSIEELPLLGGGMSVHKGDILAEVAVDAGGQTSISSITRASADRLALGEGQPVTVLIMATEVMVGKD